MAAYVVVEMTVKNEEARKRYSEKAAKTLEESGGRFIVRGEWASLAGTDGLKGGGIIEFPDREKALAWYASSAYLAAIPDREEAMECRFRLVG